MKFTEFADSINKQIEITYHPKSEERPGFFLARFGESAIVSESNSIIPDNFGTGETIEGALTDYAAKVSKRLLVFNAMQDYQEEHRAPDFLIP